MKRATNKKSGEFYTNKVPKKTWYVIIRKNETKPFQLSENENETN